MDKPSPHHFVTRCQCCEIVHPCLERGWRDQHGMQRTSWWCDDCYAVLQDFPAIAPPHVPIEHRPNRPLAETGPLKIADDGSIVMIFPVTEVHLDDDGS